MISYIIKVVIKAALHLFWIYPVDDSKITLLNELSYTYGDSLKYIDLFIRKALGEEYTVVFPIKEGLPVPDNGDIVVKPGSFRYFKELLTSGVIVTNAGGVSYLPKRKTQMIISTWHGGGPYKRTSTDVYNDFWYKKQVALNSSNTDYILSSCKYFSEIEAKSMGYEDNKIIPAGLPRNDILFCDHSAIAAKVREHYGITSDTRFVLFAPTFRSSNKTFDNANSAEGYIELDITMLLDALRERFGVEWVCGVRLHPKLADVDMSGLNVINCTTYSDMQELLCCADAVISDYSSLIWDYSFTYRPVFLYAPDIEQYEKERGFYMPVSEWPYPLAHSNEEMRQNILNFDEEYYIEAVKNHHKASGSFEKGHACEMVLDLIGRGRNNGFDCQS